MIGTSNGLNIFDPKEGIVNEFFNTERGLSSNYICGILPEENGNYWITTFDGISYYDQNNFKNLFRSFDQANGFSQDVFNPFAFYRSPDGHCFVGGMNGLSVFRSEDVLTEEELPDGFNY